jgi:F0F1-type ATP synthase assembly protein I
MSQQSPPPASPDDRPQGDPWHAFGYIVSGVGVYGALGWLGDQLLGTTFLVAIGILVGAVFGIYMTYARFNKVLLHGTDGSASSTPPDTHPQD